MHIPSYPGPGTTYHSQLTCKDGQSASKHLFSKHSVAERKGLGHVVSSFFGLWTSYGRGLSHLLRNVGSMWGKNARGRQGNCDDHSNSAISWGWENAFSWVSEPPVVAGNSSLPKTAGKISGDRRRELGAQSSGMCSVKGEPGAQGIRTQGVSLMQSSKRHGFPLSRKSKTMSLASFYLFHFRKPWWKHCCTVNVIIGITLECRASLT